MSGDYYGGRVPALNPEELSKALDWAGTLGGFVLDQMNASEFYDLFSTFFQRSPSKHELQQFMLIARVGRKGVSVAQAAEAAGKLQKADNLFEAVWLLYKVYKGFKDGAELVLFKELQAKIAKQIDEELADKYE